MARILVMPRDCLFSLEGSNPFMPVSRDASMFLSPYLDCRHMPFLLHQTVISKDKKTFYFPRGRQQLCCFPVCSMSRSLLAWPNEKRGAGTMSLRARRE